MPDSKHLKVNSLPLLPPRLPEKKIYPKDQLLFVLGARDPEMDEIEEILTRLRIGFMYATKDGERVHPGNSYAADRIEVPASMLVVFVECDSPSYIGEMKRIDHHNPGDFGYELSAKEFWNASSLGQVYYFLEIGRLLSERHLEIAAIDHCRIDAQLGNCPGIDRLQAREFSRHLIAERGGVLLSEVTKCIKQTKKELLASPVTVIGRQKVIDYLHRPTGCGYSLEYLCAQEAVADLNRPALIKNKNRAQDPPKVMLYGPLTNYTLRMFPEWAESRGMKEPIVVPKRKIAIGFLAH
jgi:hypothetical protein